MNITKDLKYWVNSRNNEWDKELYTKEEAEKLKFRLEDYQGNYVMHCNTEEKAKVFCDFLHDIGRVWEDNILYSEATRWEIYESDTVYYFNTGFFGSIQYMIEDFIILEFDEFDWE